MNCSEKIWHDCRKQLLKNFIMKKNLILLFIAISSSVFAQNTQAPHPPVTTCAPVKLHYDEFWISTCLGAGGVVSTNIINSGAVIPFRTEFLWQRKHRRLGFGFGHELEITPQSLANLIISGEKPGISKLYFVYEKYIFRNFPINLGFSSHIGFFGPAGGSARAKGDTVSNVKGGLFVNIGPALELGVRPIYLFVRPDLEFQSWSALHKQIQATATVGLKLKFLSAEEKQRRAAVKAARHKHRMKKEKQA